jgi:MATE family multidrug resistance protein
VVIILPLSLEILVPTVGFMGSALAILIYQVSQALILLAYLAWQKPHHVGTWPGMTLQYWKEAMEWEPFSRYLSLGAGGMLASGEWIWWEFISLLIGTLGVIPLSVHTIPTQVLTVAFMLPMGIGTGLSIRIGATLPHNVGRAKALVKGTLLWSMILFVTVSILLYTCREHIFRLFTTDPIVLAGAEEIWWKVVAYYFSLCIFGILNGIANGLGMQWTVGIVNLIFLWFLALPGLYIHAIQFDGGLNAAWTWIYPPYFGMNAILAYRFVINDWDAIAFAIRKREGIQYEPMVSSNGATIVASEQTPLLV